MDKPSLYFTLSGFISLSLFALFLFLFLFMMLSQDKINTFALNKDVYISISLDNTNISNKTRNKIPIIKKEEIKVKEETQELDIEDLFSEVWTKEIKIQKKEEKIINNKRLQLIQKKIKKTKENTGQEIKEMLENEKTQSKDNENKKTSSGDEVNEYLAKIQAIVYKHFIPPANSEGNSVKVVIELSTYGKLLDFRIIQDSSNQALNLECAKIKDRLRGVLFPMNPEGKSSRTVVNIISDK